MMFERRYDTQFANASSLAAFSLSLLVYGQACAPEEGTGANTVSHARTSSVRQELELDPRHIGYLAYDASWAASGCPRFDSFEKTPSDEQWIGSWRGVHTFGPAALDPSEADEPREDLPARLRGYCSFRFVPSPNHPDAFAPFPRATTQVSDVSLEDGPIVSGLETMAELNPESEVNHGDVFKELRLVAQEHWDYDGRAHALARPKKDPTVHVAIIDNAPYGSRGEVAPEDAPHARAVTNVVRAIACPAGEGNSKVPCNVSHSGHLALPLVSANKTDFRRGGYFGTRGQVAAAIWDAVHRFDATPGDVKERMILNLSIGWQADPKRLSPADRAVEDVLAYARCKGHLVIAAAGNRARLFDTEPGPLFPAAFENRAAPSATTCATLFDLKRSPDKKETTARDPLVFAVGAVDPYDQPIRATRVDGRPPLAAYGFLVTTDDTLPHASSYRMAPLSGSSIAAAAASGVAALVWSVVPELEPAQVMQVVYEAGVDLSADRGRAKSDFPVVSPSTGARLPIHRLSMCRAVMLATGNSLEQCRDTVPAYAGDVQSVDFWSTDPSVQGTTHPLSAHEDARLMSDDVATPLQEPWAGPQPTSPGCSTCRLWNSWWQYASTPEPVVVLDVALTPTMQAQAGTYQMRLTTLTDEGESSVAIVPPSQSTPNFTVSVPSKVPVKSASLTFQQDQNGTTIETYEQILVQ